MLTNRRVEACRAIALAQRLVCFAAGVAILAASVVPAGAQSGPAKYLEVPVDPAYDDRPKDDTSGAKQAARARKSARNKLIVDSINPTLKGENSFADADRTTFFAFLDNVIFAEMTQLDDESLSQLPSRRRLFLQQYLQRASSARVHEELVAHTFDRMKKIAEQNFHPAVRHSAMLVIGMLNQDEAVTIGANQAPPNAYDPALKYMMDQLADAKQMDAVKVAALYGILRHAKLDGQRSPENRLETRTVAGGIEGGTLKVSLVDQMLALIESPPPMGRSPEGHRWLQRRAIEVLGALRDVGAGDRVAIALDKIISDESATPSLRCTATWAYGQLNFKTPKSIDPSASAKKMAVLAANLSRRELAMLDDLEEEIKEKRKNAAAADAAVPGVGGGLPSPMGGVGSPAGIPPGYPAGGDAGDAGVPPEPFTPGIPGIPGVSGLGDPMGGFGGDGSTLTPTYLENYHIDLARRRIKYFVQYVQLGLLGEDGKKGIARYAPDDPHKTFILDVTNRLTDLMKATDAGLDEKEKDPATAFREAVDDNVKKLEEFLAAGPAVAPPVAPPAAGTGDEPADAAPPVTVPPPVGAPSAETP